jgi:hypothetical protein
VLVGAHEQKKEWQTPSDETTEQTAPQIACEEARGCEETSLQEASRTQQSD